ncbi:MAG: hypothetical protein JGK27_30895 [Microcoleus sp. PH2017_20_SFW_D_A]|uniref:hypothetical protein n=1 Tax=unclassified Microcoleus TaxID=2642155 RepID=UPI001D506668|nr:MULTISPECIES: hypothetical protein [unclassified Microcoleus]MCC3506720.1 hypothetical protein [Microcoleus sp. PH2017_19_SFW_U_A]MCC3525997.1 hypothetical protein [Microcoleus sp. PH2017_20_SFW_D_A]MCC3557068.1 hypothetical protein [Microcoleus sp. PH2017_35_SFW_U_B]MCC3585935.1 hypothetical protein [Microcoleus sp. PH2017_30_WIL_O_A]MCC3476113.1 hypothetical protein [Microcoleus sp. PH2017_13_LAR_U_A]
MSNIDYFWVALSGFLRAVCTMREYRNRQGDCSIAIDNRLELQKSENTLKLSALHRRLHLSDICA